LKKDYLGVFKRFVPLEAADYCLALYQQHGFEFKIKKSRRTKFGDYRFDPTHQKHVITINNDLNHYAFLITYLHEFAHLITYQKHKNQVNPHGEEWKNTFKMVSLPVLNPQVFPELLLKKFAHYLRSPKASSCSDPNLYALLRQYDHPDDTCLLKTLQVGDQFLFNKTSFQYLELKRTRILCLQINSGRKYLIAQIASVKKISPSDG
jgi:SprT protein